ncbi:membrane or secreted protein [Flavilitoribacter nigricans]|uniref:Membrane or secreted protein n=1 Tax=Flavilitoribacter nigricans (strain ATCC 23147 / DSM 23189 / NBRC 102662 / NCIMB 1420 / SS-2) TaxID=1122177 RepID=A0A2D0NEM6_FLAN2|nr:membrane or secreted protein [Flavilitoribacter nigricans]PHN06233.1 membrane or secreted protein [Flavilitoribacter nigricans DSM 23189 = NBRC 102662]
MLYSYPIRIFLLLTVFLVGESCARNATKGTVNINMDDPMPTGAWSRQFSEGGKDLTEILLIADGYYSLTRHEQENGAFIWTKGGYYTKSGMFLRGYLEFHSADQGKVGELEEWKLEPKGKELALSLAGNTSTWQSIDVGEKTPLTGAWLFAGRERDGEVQRRDTNQPRKTMKLLSGTRFQWIAYNTESGEFFGSGGGEYTAEDGAYVEKIRFFSRDDNRVGAELPFDFSRQDEEWHHSGKSSSGQPMYEIWATRTQ